MSDRRKIIEHLKTALIILLLISAFVLLYHTGYYSGAFENLEAFLSKSSESAVGGEESDTGELSFGNSTAMEIAVCMGDRGIYGNAWNGESVAEDYGRFSAFLAEALGSASAASETDAESWLEALASESVYIRFFAPQPLELLSVQLGTKLSPETEDMAADLICLDCSSDEVKLLFSSGGRYYLCSTAVSASALRERMGEYGPNGAVFSAFDPLLSDISENRLVLSDFNSVPLVKSSGIARTEQIADRMMPLLGLNAYTASQYTEAGGTAVYLDGSSTLRITPTGAVEFEADGVSSVTASDGSLYDCIQLSFGIMESASGIYSGDTEIYLSSAEITDEGCLVSFDYAVDGIPVRFGEGSAAVFTFGPSGLASAEINFRSYSLSGDRLELLPMYQAAAIASGSGSPRLSLIYFDSQDNLDCYWVNE